MNCEGDRFLAIQPIANNGYEYGRCQSFLASALFCGSMTNTGFCHTFSVKMADKMGCLAGNGTINYDFWAEIFLV